jgi:hypothetical protein
VVVRKTNGNVETVTASSRATFATVNPNVKIVLTKVMRTAASENSHSITTKDAAARKMSGNVTMETASN